MPFEADSIDEKRNSIIYYKLTLVDFSPSPTDGRCPILERLFDGGMCSLEAYLLEGRAVREVSKVVAFKKRLVRTWVSIVCHS